MVARGISMFTLVGLLGVKSVSVVLGYDVFMKLISPLLDQGYQLLVDNFYTSPILLKNIFLRQTPATGTISENRKGFPTKMKEENPGPKESNEVP